MVQQQELADRFDQDAALHTTGPPARTLWGLAIAAGVLLVGFAGLTASVWRSHAPLAADRRVIQWLDRAPLAGSSRWIRAVAELGSAPAAIIFGLALWFWARRRQDRRLTKIAVLGPLLAVVAGVGIAKPFIGRQLGDTFTFPSGHSTTAAAFATTFLVFALVAPGGAPRTASRWRIVSTTAVSLMAVAVAIAVVVIGWHVPSEVLGGLVLGTAVVLMVSIVCFQWVPADRPVIESRALKALGAVVLGGTVVLVGAVRLPFLVLSPGSLIPLNSAVTVNADDAAAPGPLHGTYSGLTVRASTLTLSRWVWHELSQSIDPIVSREAVIPAGESGEDYHNEQLQVFVDASQTAVAVAEKALGQPVTISGDGALITAVLPGGPAADALRPGDVIVELDGEPITTDTELRDALAAAAENHARNASGEQPQMDDERIPVDLVVRDRNGDERSETVRLAVLESTGRFGLGVGVATSNLQFDLPTKVSVEGGEVGGPSAGLLTALTVYDVLSPEDLAAGRHITGTGTLSLDGRVGDIGGIEEKARAAVAAGADVFLAPANQAADAKAAVAGEKMQIVAVDTFDEALTVLRAA